MSYRRCLSSILTAVVLALLGLALFTFNAQAGPVAPFDIVITQPDGTSITVSRWGDEYSHGIETTDGYTLVQDASSGFWVYADVQSDGTLAPVMPNGDIIKAGIDAPASGMEKHLRPTVQEPMSMQSMGSSRGQNQGSAPMLFLLVEFGNKPHNYPDSDFQAKAFGASNSIADFYKQASNSQISSQLNIVPVTESNGTANDGVIGWLNIGSTFPADAYASASSIVSAGLIAADPFINFSTYDNDGDHYITSSELHVVVILAGFEESYCYPGCESGLPVIWAHRGQTDSAVSVDSSYLIGVDSADGDKGGYAIFGEKHGYTSASYHEATMGVMTHELGHDLSWPDLYDTSDLSQGVGNWSIMGSGSWNGVTLAGDSPALPDAWLKWYQGWITPTTVTAGQHYNVNTAYNTHQTYIIGSNPGGVDWDFYNHSGSGEYWLVENRAKSSYDAGLPGCGLLIWHIDETVRSDNAANANRDRPLVGLEQADGLNQLYNAALNNRGDGGDPFPGSTGKLAFNSATNPDSRYNSNAFSRNALAIDNTGCSSTMGFTFTREAIDTQMYYVPLVTTPINGQVNENGAPKSGQTVKMYYSTNGGSSYTYRTSAKTNSEGYFYFANPPLEDSSQSYFLSWENTSNTSWLYRYYSESVDSTSTNLVFNINVRDISMSSPVGGSVVTFPMSFFWNVRPTTTDSYKLDFYDSSQYYMGYLGPYGYVSSKQMTSAPGGTYTYTNYWWSVGAFVPNGVVYGYWIRRISWSEYSGPGLDGNPIAGPQVTEMPNICSDPHPAEWYSQQNNLAEARQ